jgi:hypothetical protein
MGYIFFIFPIEEALVVHFMEIHEKIIVFGGDFTIYICVYHH